MNRSNPFALFSFLLCTAAGSSRAHAQCAPQWDAGPGAPGLQGGEVYALTVFDDGTGPALYAGGQFTMAGGAPAQHIAKWNGSVWSQVGSGLAGAVRGMQAFDDGSGLALYAVGGGFWWNGSVYSHIAKWNGSTWSDVGGGLDASGHNATTFALTVFDDGSGAGPALYAGGWFTEAGGNPANYVARWDGFSWSALGAGLDHGVYALTSFNDGSGPALYAGGFFTMAGGIQARGIARWNGSTWSAVGSGLYPATVNCLLAHNDGSGQALFGAGYITMAGGLPVDNIAKWTGTTWMALGGGLPAAPYTPVYCLARFDDTGGGGMALYAGGTFQLAGGAPGNHIARWDGSTWSPVAHGTNDWVYAMTVFDDGSGHGPALYVGGQFTNAGGIPVGGIARWGRFGLPPTVVQGPVSTTVNAGHAASLAVQASGSMPLGYHWRHAGVPMSDGGAVSGSRTSRLRIDPVDASYAGRYDVIVSDPCGLAWSAPAFLTVLPPVGAGFCTGDGNDPNLTVSCPCSNQGGAGHGCAGSTNLEGAILDASGSTLVDPVTHTDTVVLTCGAMPNVTTGIVVQGDADSSGGVLLGNGIRCAGGQLVRIATVSAAGGVAEYPGAGDPSISTRGNVMPGSGQVRFYQVVYRDTDSTFCTGSGIDVSNAYRIVW